MVSPFSLFLGKQTRLTTVRDGSLRTELDEERRGLLRCLGKQDGIDCHAGLARVGRERREEQAGGSGGGGEGVEARGDLGHELGNHVGLS